MLEAWKEREVGRFMPLPHDLGPYLGVIASHHIPTTINCLFLRGFYYRNCYTRWLFLITLKVLAVTAQLWAFIEHHPQN
jgi:hypothetical protein